MSNSMKAFTGVFLLVSCLAIAINGSRRAVPMDTYKMDLNDPPETRWNHILQPFMSSIPLVVDYFDSLLPKDARPLAEAIAANVDGYLGEYGKEIRGIAKYTKLDLGMLVGLNLIYELRKLGGPNPNITSGWESSSDDFMFGCTSIIAKNESGHIFHGRNMDWNLPENLRNMTVQIQFYRGDKYLFTGITTVGYVGIITGVNPTGFSISINSRAGGGSLILNALEAILINKSRLATHLSREVLEASNGYTEAHQILSSTPLVCPAYYILAGNRGNEGVIMSRERGGNPNEQVLGSAEYSDWYVMETNYDYWKSVPTTDNRRAYAHRYLDSRGRANVSSVEGLLEVLSLWPVWNPYTAYTATMDPSEGKMKGYNTYTS